MLEIKFIIEALLFTSDKPLTAREINTWLPEDNLSDIKNALEELRTEYDAMNRSFVIKEVAQGYQFRTKSEYAPFILQMLKTAPTRLSRAALETLAIVAYEQPVLRQEIERLRGVDVGGILRTLMEKELVRIMGRKNLPGRPLIYGTSKKFLEVFDLKDLKSLPKLKEIKDFGYEEQGTEIPPEKVIQDEASKEQPKEPAEEISGEASSPDESNQDSP